MSTILQSGVRNTLLRTMSASDFAALQPHLRSVPTEQRMMLIEPRAPIVHMYFPEAGFASITTERSAVGQIELGMVGSEGLVGAAPVLLGVDRSPHEVFVQLPGEALRIPTQDLLGATAESPALLELLLRSIHVLMVQTAETAASNAVYTIEVRLARWLLMCRDRSADDDMQLTHDFLSMMLGVRRPGVTVALQILEGNRLIKATRGHIRILNRAGLEDVADDSYGVAEAEYHRLIGPA